MKLMMLVPHLSGGGGERIVADLSRNLRADELVVVVFEKKFSYPYGGRLVSLDLPIQRDSVFTRAIGLLRRIRKFRGVLKAEQPDVVLSFMGEANVINAWLAKRPILSIHSHLSSLAEAGHSTADEGISRLRSRLEAAIYRVLMSLLFKRATVVAVADSIGKELVEHFRLPGSRVVVIPNAVDISEIQARSQEKADCPWPEDIPAVITSGRLTAVKGQWHLIRAFAEASKEVPCRLVILGTGELERDLRKLVKDLGIEDQVYFMGWQDNPFKFMSRARVFVLSSLSEAFPLVLLEAMACGLPVVSADCPGEVHDLLSGGVGVLTPRLDGTMTSAATPVTSQQLRMADAIVTLLKDRSKYETCRNAGFQRVRDFDHESFVARYQRLIESVGSGR